MIYRLLASFRFIHLRVVWLDAFDQVTMHRWQENYLIKIIAFLIENWF